MTKRPPNGTIHDRIQADLLDSYDEELEMEIEDDRLDALTNEFSEPYRRREDRSRASTSANCSACRASW